MIDLKTLLFSLLLTLPTLSELIESINQFWEAELNARIEIYTQQEKKPWTKFLPSVGIAYNLQGKPRPTIGINLNKIHDGLQEQEKRKLNISAIHKEVDLLRKQNILKVTELYQNYSDRQELFYLKVEEFKIDSILFSFTEQAYNEGGTKISPSEYFSKKKSYLAANRILTQDRISVEELKRLIITEAHYFSL